MSETRNGRVVFNDRGYIVAEVVTGAPGGERLIGFALIGAHASESIIYGSRMQALEALQDIEERISGS